MNYFENLSEELSKQYGWSKSHAKEYMFKAGAHSGLGWSTIIDVGATVGGEHNRHRSETDMKGLNEVKNISSGEAFQNHYQNLERYSSGLSFSSTNDEGNRLAKEHSQSLDQMNLYQQSYQNNLAKLDQISKAETAIESGSTSIKSNLSQDFMNWASERYHDQGGFARVKIILGKNEFDSEKRSLFEEYYSNVLPEKVLGLFQNEDNSSSFGQRYKEQSSWIEKSIRNENPVEINSLAETANLHKGNVDSQKAKIMDNVFPDFAERKANSLNKQNIETEKMKKRIQKKRGK